jgi:hypothetical protein
MVRGKGAFSNIGGIQEESQDNHVEDSDFTFGSLEAKGQLSKYRRRRCSNSLPYKVWSVAFDVTLFAAALESEAPAALLERIT